MKRNYQLNEENRIIVTQEIPFFEQLPYFEFPDTFDYEHQIDWKIINGELVYDKLPEPESPEPPENGLSQDEKDFISGLMEGLGITQ